MYVPHRFYLNVSSSSGQRNRMDIRKQIRQLTIQTYICQTGVMFNMKKAHLQYQYSAPCVVSLKIRYFRRLFRWATYFSAPPGL